MIIELLVGLKIPDTTAITTFRTLEDLGYKIHKLDRKIYYRFDTDDATFKEKIVKTDILVNSNKNTSTVIDDGLNIPNSVLIQETDDDCAGIISTLKKLGFNNIKSMQQGTLWTFDADADTIKKATEELLYNKHYQKAKYY